MLPSLPVGKEFAQPGASWAQVGKKPQLHPTNLTHSTPTYALQDLAGNGLASGPSGRSMQSILANLASSRRTSAFSYSGRRCGDRGYGRRHHKADILASLESPNQMAVKCQLPTTTDCQITLQTHTKLQLIDPHPLILLGWPVSCFFCLGVTLALFGIGLAGLGWLRRKNS